MNKFKLLNVSRGLLILACAVVGFVFTGCASGKTSTEVSVTVVAPNGGEQVQRGGVYQIRWNTSGLSGSVDIELWKGGLAQSVLAAGVSDLGSWAWSVPGAQELGDDYTIRVRSSSNPAVSDDSDATFSIIEGSDPPMTVVTPNGGEVWGTGSARTITWNTEGTILLVHVELWQSGAKVADIATDLTNSGQFTWAVPQGFETGNDYRVRLTASNNAAVTDESDADFTIRDSLPADCLDVLNTGGSTGDGTYMVDPDGSGGNPEIEVYCDMTAGGVTYEQLGFGQYNVSHTGWTLLSFAELSTVPVQQALIWAYNRQGGMVNLNPGWSSTNCCFAVSDSAEWLDFGSGLDYRVYPSDQNGTDNCNGTYNDAFMRFHRSAFPGEMTLASNYFVTYPPSLRTGCSDNNNPGFFFVRY